jgi:hypothetical protein
VTTRISVALRMQVRRRAGHRCEYCLLAEDDAFFSHEVDHVIAEKHGGVTQRDNLALACFDCNRFKGSDIASLDPESGNLVPLFNPRTNHFAAIFKIDHGVIHPLTAVARATEQLLKLNLPIRVDIRRALAACGRYPDQ